jgi:capsid protein
MIKEKTLLQKIAAVFTGAEETAPRKTAHFIPGGSGYSHLFSESFNGEKGLGDMGPAKNYILDYATLRARSWQSMLESELSTIIVNRFVQWVIGEGLKLQCEPNATVLNAEGIEMSKEQKEAFNEITEARFAVWAESEESSYTLQGNLNTIAGAAYQNSLISGDSLVILRLENGKVNVQLIDAAQVCSPMFGNDYKAIPAANGNVIRHGIEMDARGRHIAYHVQTDTFKWERIPARSATTNLRTAFLVYGTRHKLSNHRGIPLLTVVLETMKKLERYKEASVASAEEIANVVYQIKHELGSTGESPLVNAIRSAQDADVNLNLPHDLEGNRIADKVTATTSRQTFNLTPGSELKSVDAGKGQLYFKDFYQTNFEMICAAAGIPPNVALQVFNDSFSASRAATKSWEHLLRLARKNFYAQFYKYVYEYWLHFEITQQRIDAEGYREGVFNKNTTLLQAYRMARFTGPMFPHIDPLKEANAQRILLGPLGKNLPLTNLEQATELLGTGDSDNNIEQFSEELKYAEGLGLQLDNEPEVVETTIEEEDKDEE